MTQKQRRINQLDDLKQADTLALPLYRVELLNSSFMTVGIWEFETMEEAEEKYIDLLDHGNTSDFVQKYAVVPF